MVVLKPVVKMSLTFKRGWDKPIRIEDEELEKAIWRAARERIPYEERILVPLKNNKLLAMAAIVYYNQKTNKVNVTLLYPLLDCEV